ncbi:ankyrin repeat domain-containing protein [Cupriavidus necator]|uniref:ankyrin repeat domain-containing protein n=1 Tax=Cupriavidus necator TaxID=106590 RepID=UPI0009B85258|nr:ankyrin repeat domain-containing protein [Cupriavidus necator]
MMRPAARTRRQALNELLGLMGMLVGGGLLAAQGSQTLARPAGGAASQPGAARPPRNTTARAPVHSDGISALDRNLITAAGIGDQDMVARLLAAGATARAIDERGRSALLAAVQNRHLEVARMLLLAGADVNCKDADANSPFLLAAATGQPEMVQLALAHGADLASTDRYHGTALIAASQHGHVEVVKLLLKAGVAIDHVNDLGWTALLEAVVLGDGSARYEETVQLLLDAGADANLADREGVTPTRHARERGYKTMVKMLMRVRGH